MKKRTVSIIILISIFCLVFMQVIQNKNLYTDNIEIYDVILFWGQSNMQGSAFNKEENRFNNQSEEEVEAFSKITGIDVDILYNTTRMNHTKIEQQPGTAYEYKYLTNSLAEISADTKKLGEELTYNTSTGKLQSLKRGDLYANAESSGINMIPEFCRTYYQRTGHKVVAIIGAVPGISIEMFLPTNDSDYIKSNFSGYMYEGIVEKYQAAVSYLQNNGYKIGNKLWVSCQGESNVESLTSKNEYQRLFLKVHNNLKKDLGITKGAIIETSSEIGKNYQGVETIHQAQEAIIKENNDIILGSAYFYEHHIPEQSVYESQEYINEIFTDATGNKLTYSEAFNRASYSLCYPYNTIHFTSACLSHVGREAAISFSNEYE